MLVELKSEHIYKPTCGSTCAHLHKCKHVAEDPKAHFPMEGQFCCDWSCTMKPRSIWLPMKLLLDLHNWLAICCNVLRHLVQIPDWQRNGLMPFPCTQRHRSWNAKQHTVHTKKRFRLVDVVGMTFCWVKESHLWRFYTLPSCLWQIHIAVICNFHCCHVAL